jgi:hypothetical protein
VEKRGRTKGCWSSFSDGQGTSSVGRAEIARCRSGASMSSGIEAELQRPCVAKRSFDLYAAGDPTEQAVRREFARRETGSRHSNLVRRIHRVVFRDSSWDLAPWHAEASPGSQARGRNFVRAIWPTSTAVIRYKCPPASHRGDAPAMDRLGMFALNIRLLIGLLLCAAIAALLIVGTWTLLNVFRFRAAQRRGWSELHRGRFGPDGQPMPPTGPGVCDGCQVVGAGVHYLASGRKLCPACYEQERVEVSG